MAGIFNLFGEISDLDKGQVMKPLTKSKTSIGVSGTSLKTLNQIKPKGLSIRSNSDSNVSADPRLNNINQDVCNKQQECLKPKLTQLDNSGHPVSPRKELAAKKLYEHPGKIRDSSPKNITSDKKNFKLQKTFDEYIFKKPLPPKKLIKKSYPEPENLAPYHDMQIEFDDIYTKTIENEFKELFLKKNEVLPYEDEGFESDPEPLEFELPKSCISSKLVDEDWKKHWTLDLPEISDDDGNF